MYYWYNKQHVFTQELETKKTEGEINNFKKKKKMSDGDSCENEQFHLCNSWFGDVTNR